MNKSLQEINSFSLQISQAIESSDWEQLSNVLTQRQTYLETLLNSPLSENEQHVIQSILESVQAMDQLFITAVQSKKIELLKDFQNIAQGQRGVNAYYVTATN